MVADDSIESDEAFNRQLKTLLDEAASNGVELEGGWPVQTDTSDIPDWDIEITALAESDG